MKDWIKNNAARLSKVIISVIVFLTAFNAVYSVLSFKNDDGVTQMKYLYRQKKNSVDVLLMGTSHTFVNINTQELYDSYGIASYILAGSNQLYWNTYYCLLEAIKTQKPKLVVLDIFSSTYETNYSDNAQIITGTFGMRDPITRYKALKVSCQENSFSDYLFDYRIWHSRYTELESKDFGQYYDTPEWRYYKGFRVNTNRAHDAKRGNTHNITSTKPLPPKIEEYLRKIMELCRKKDIPILLVKAPATDFSSKDDFWKKYNRTREIADEYNVELINFNGDEWYSKMGLDFSQDYADIYGHLNYYGSVKYTDKLAEEILERFDLPDRRGQSEYKSWEMQGKYIRGQIDDDKLKNESDISEYFGKLEREGYTVALMTVNNSDKILKDCSDTLDKWKTDPNNISDNSLYIFKNGNLDYVANDLCWEKSVKLKNNTFEFRQSANNKIAHSLRYNGAEQIKEESGCYLVVYDNFTEKLVEITHWDMKGDKTAIQNDDK